MTQTSAVVICTKDRPKELRICLESVRQALVDSIKYVVVVDSSQDVFENRNAIQILQSKNPQTEILHITTAPSLPRQRVIGFNRVKQLDFVHFLDDDVRVATNYFEIVEDFLQANSNAVGAGGQIVNQAPPSNWKHRNAGKLLKSGTPVGVYQVSESKRVEWLPGCAMSFLCSAVEERDFATALTGYALFEDVFLTSRMSQKGSLHVLENAYLYHDMSLTNRDSRETLAFYEIYNRYVLVSSNLEVFNLFFFYIWLVKRLFRLFVRSIKRARLTKELKNSIIALREISKLRRKPVNPSFDHSKLY